jgi:hypothetical protein
VTLLAASVCVTAVIVLAAAVDRSIFAPVGVVAVAAAIIAIASARSDRNAGLSLYTGDTDIAAALAEVRKEAAEIRAVWAARYGDEEVRHYFTGERDDLAANKRLTITRVIRPAVIPRELHRDLTDLKRTFAERYSLRADEDRQELELFVADYAPDSGRQGVGMMVFIDANNQRPALGLKVDPNRDHRWAGVVRSLREWFDAHVTALPAWDPETIERWNEIADRYDGWVTDNASLPFLRDFIRAERGFVRSYIGDLVTSDHEVCLVEIGCATGRAILDYPPPEHADAVKLLIGIDNAPAMVNAAEHNRVQALKALRLSNQPADLMEKASFYELSAFALTTQIENGLLHTPQSLASLSPRKGYLIDANVFNRSTRVYLCLLNTLGVISPKDRCESFVLHSLRAMGEGDHLIVSVFDEARFDSTAPDLYSALSPMIGAFDPGNVDSANRAYEIRDDPGYYSHWFGAGELETLLKVGANRLTGRYSVDVDSLDDMGWVARVVRAA